MQYNKAFYRIRIWYSSYWDFLSYHFSSCFVKAKNNLKVKTTVEIPVKLIEQLLTVITFILVTASFELWDRGPFCKLEDWDVSQAEEKYPVINSSKIYNT